MAVRLSDQELRALRHSLEIILDVDLAADHPGEWSSQLLAATIPLLGAERALVCVPDRDEFALYFNDPEMVRAATEYLGYYQPLDSFLGARRLELGLSTYVCEELITPAEKSASEHWNDWVLPHRLLDPCGIAIDLDGRAMPAILTWYHEREDERRRFGERGKLLLDLMEPAFRRVVEERARRQGRRSLTDRLAESMPVPVAMFDRGGRLLRTSALFEARFGDTRRGAWLLEQARRLSQDLESGPEDAASGVDMTRRVRFDASHAAGQFELMGSWVDREGLDGGTVLVAFLEAEVPTPRAIREAWGLTARESEVAELLGRRLSNREIASALYISPSTARRHTERVLKKLGIRSRRRVREVLLGVGRY